MIKMILNLQDKRLCENKEGVLFSLKWSGNRCSKILRMSHPSAYPVKTYRHKFIVDLFLVHFVLFMALFLSNSGSAQTVLTLENALNIASENSPDIKRSSLNLERNRETLNAQNAALKSNFSLSVTPFDFSRDRQFNSLFSIWSTSETKQSLGTFRITQPIKWSDGTLSLVNRFSWQDAFSDFQGVRTKSFTNNLFLSFDQPIFTYNRTKLDLQALELNLEDASLSYSIQKLALERNVTQGFYNVFQNQMSVQIANEEYINQQSSYEIIKNKVDAGISAKEELYQAELNLATSKSNYQNQQVLLENAKDQFKQLIGISLFDEISVIADVSHVSVEVELQKAIDHGISKRMELRQREIDIENSQFDLIRTSATNEFQGNVSLSVGLFGDNEQFKDIYANPTNSQQIALSVEIPLWDWGEKRSRMKSVEAVVKTNELGLEDEKNNIIIAIRSVYRNLQNLENQIEIARQNERNAQLTYEINRERYENGDLTSMDLNLFQTQLSEKKIALVNALINYRIELLNLKIQSLWDFEKNRSVAPDRL